jgi:transposase-like protein
MSGDGNCPVCNHDLRESYDCSPDTRWECTHCPWGWTEHNHDTRDRAEDRYVHTKTDRQEDDL